MSMDRDTVDDQLRVAIVRSGRVCHIVLGGELDLLTAERLLEALEQVFDDAPGVTALDLRGLEFIDVAGIRTVLEFARRARVHAIPYTIIGARAVVRRAFDLAGLTPSLPFVDAGACVSAH